ncbi:hypothetical protein L202_02268 [Cryptococcus amylolentus CBS 6039]|uniref:Uncharacterized protein n=1 Tax=Cryptococcus amylolentus CBS 6039 TaxID=1295533 RepID=A0A1E3HZY0_9TREE|nr:hypothetical protein L202_02268 [Cryptococcus amylolentus CBS 6039]ODN81924.1 hypothetical protein L202_02268 [Cryptococcus amylolentus CBS 6039]
MSLVPTGAPRDAAITIGPFKPARPGYGPVLSYLQAAQLTTPLKIHPLLQLRTWDPKPYPKYLAWNAIEVGLLLLVKGADKARSTGREGTKEGRMSEE